MKKGQGISINMVIIAAMALIVLIIAIILVVRGGKNLNQGTAGCTAQGGVCRDGPNTDEVNIGTYDCTPPQQCYRYNFAGQT